MNGSWSRFFIFSLSILALYEAMARGLGWVRRHAFLLFLLGLLIAWSVLLFLVPPERIVRIIGVDNTYFVTFLLGVIGGVSFLTSAPFYASVATFAHGGSVPYLLGLSGGLGIFVSDFVFYSIARYGRAALEERWKPLFARLTRWLNKLPPEGVAAGVYAYSSLPLPSDILMAALAFGGYPFLRFAPFLFAGCITAVTVIAYLGRSGFATG